MCINVTYKYVSVLYSACNVCIISCLPTATNNTLTNDPVLQNLFEISHFVSV